MSERMEWFVMSRERGRTLWRRHLPPATTEAAARERADEYTKLVPAREYEVRAYAWVQR